MLGGFGDPSKTLEMKKLQGDVLTYRSSSDGTENIVSANSYLRGGRKRERYMIVTG